MKIRGPIRWLLLASLLAGCFDSSREPESALAPDQVDAWAAELLEERADKDQEFATSATSPMAGTQYLKSEPADIVFLNYEETAFGLAYEASEEAVISMELRDTLWHWEVRREGVVCKRADEEIASGAPVDGPATFSVGDMVLSFYPSEDRVTFIVFDSEREEMRSFEHLLYFEPDPAYAVVAELRPLAEPEELTVPTSRDLKKTFYRYATLHFLIDGEERQLTALKPALEGPGSEGLFIPFRDGTTGHETYGAGRFLEIDDPETSVFTLDFNRAFNPLCNYSPAYNCAIPPRENHLEVAILAGEKTYPH